jgi:predicted nuclease of predicted toxin-antitoxin system
VSGWIAYPEVDRIRLLEKWRRQVGPGPIERRPLEFVPNCGSAAPLRQLVSNNMTHFERITVDPAQMDGVPCVRHLRIPVASVLRLLAGGLSEGEIVAEAVRGFVRDGAGNAASALGVKFLIDNALPPLLAQLLVRAGQDAVHVRAYNMQADNDQAILARALAEDRIVVSADTDFGAILANQEASHPSFILFRDPNLLVASDYAAMLVPALSLLEPELASGCVAVFRNGRLRVRKLPLA